MSNLFWVGVAKHDFMWVKIYILSQGFNSYIAIIDFRRQILTSNVDPRTVRIKIFVMAVNRQHTVGVQMKQK